MRMFETRRHETDTLALDMESMGWTVAVDDAAEAAEAAALSIP
jgi:hypothetical protein